MIGCGDGVLLYRGGEVTNSLAVTDKWREPLDWQRTRPSLFVRDHTAYVTDPEKKQVHTVDLESGKKTDTVTLPAAPNEFSGVDLPDSDHCRAPSGRTTVGRPAHRARPP